MRSAVFGRAWLHACLILGDHVLARRQRVGAEGGWRGDGDTEALLGAEDLLDPEPPAWRARGCRDRRGDRCDWLLCKYEGYKTRLVHEKYQSDVEVLKKTETKMRAMPEDQERRYLENKFLMRLQTGRHMHSTVGYMFEAEAKNCAWAKNVLTEFEAWLKGLLPERHACVTKTVGSHRDSKQICSEVFTNEFKNRLHYACQADLEFIEHFHENTLRDLESRDAKTLGHTELDVSPYDKANAAAAGLAAGGLAGATVASGMFFKAAGLAAVASVAFYWLVIPLLIIAIPAIAYLVAYLICVRPKFPALKKKWIEKFKKSPKHDEEKAENQKPHAAGDETPHVAGDETPHVAGDETPHVAGDETPHVVQNDRMKLIAG